MKSRYALATVIAAFACVAIVTPRAQQPAAQGEGRGQAAGQPLAAGRGGPTAPPGINWPSPPLPDGPIVLDTGIQHQVKVNVIKGFNQPWSLAFLPDGDILVTERPGCLRIVHNGILDPKHVTGLPPVQSTGIAGLMDLALHPRFDENRLVYLTYHRSPSGNAFPSGIPAAGRCEIPPSPEGRGQNQAAGGGRGAAPAPGTITLARGRWDGNALVDVKDLFSAAPSGNASRIVFGKDGMLYMTVGSGDIPPPYTSASALAAPPQDPNSFGGKVLRLKDDGTVPADNPFVGRAGYRPEIFTMGHRNMLGLTVNPVTGDVWESENGPNGGDEVNVLQAGKNYGWPLVSAGRFYLGPRVSEKMFLEGMEQPIVFWVPAIATSGLTFYTGDRFPTWKGHLFAGGMRQGEVPRSGQLVRIDFNEKWEELHRESMLRELQNRVRDVRQGPDGLLYVLTAESDGALLKLEPAPPPPGRPATR